MRVDSAGNDDLAARIDDPAGIGILGRAWSRDRQNFLSGDGDIPGADAVGGNDTISPNQNVDHLSSHELWCAMQHEPRNLVDYTLVVKARQPAVEISAPMLLHAPRASASIAGARGRSALVACAIN